MTRTKRIYNKPNLAFDWWERYRQVCCGNCRMCKDPTLGKKRRLAYKYDLRKELKQLFSKPAKNS